MDLGLQGKTVIITGGSGGIGHGLCIEFAREGVNVVSASRDQKTGLKIAKRAADLGCAGIVFPIKTDITDTASVKQMLQATHDKFGPVDILINNAGGVGSAPTFFEDISEETRIWELRLNLEAVFRVTQLVGPDMLARASGSVINISSVGGVSGPMAYKCVHYSACKGFLNSFSRGLAQEWGPKGIRVNTIVPGYTVPDSNDDVSEGSFWTRLDAFGTPEIARKRFAEGTLPKVSSQPIRDLARPEDIAFTALFLASERSKQVTGQLIGVCGGCWMP